LIIDQGFFVEKRTRFIFFVLFLKKNKILKTRLLYFIIIFCCSASFAKQTHAENLVSLSNSFGLADSVSNYIQVVKGLVKSNPDSALIYADKLEVFMLSRKFKIESGEKSILCLYKGLANYNRGNYSKTRYLIEKSLNLGHVDSLEGQRYFYLALTHKKAGNYSQSAELFMKSIKYFEDSKDYYAKIGVFINLSNVLANTKQYPSALKYLSEALNLSEKHNTPKLDRIIYSGMGNVFMEMGDYNMALDQFNASYKDAKSQNYLKGQFYILINISVAKRKLGDHQESLGHLQEALLMLDSLNNIDFKMKIFYELGDFFSDLKNKKEAEYYLGQAIEIADSIHSLPDVKKIYKSYQVLYEKIGNYSKSLEYYKLHEQLKDELISRENTLKVTQLNSEFELDRKERELKLLAKQKELKEAQIIAHEAEMEKDQIFIYLLLGLGALLLLLVVAFAANNIMRYKRNEVLREKNVELQDKQNEIAVKNGELEKVNYKLEGSNNALIHKNSEIESQKEELKTQRDLINKTHEVLKLRNRDVTDSIHYAQKIQQAMLNSSFLIEGAGLEYFTFYRPRDIVSGDFYWSNVVGDNLIIAIGDCTGHGVPGAFMSCLGISLLNEIVFGRKVIEPHTMLEELRNSVIQLIATDKSTDLQIGDGMDMAVVVIDMKTNKMKFSGAMNGFSLVSDGALVEVKGDKSPIGQHIIPNHTYTMSEHQLKTGDHIYMSTDGYKDQFGGPKGKKLGKRRLNEKLLDISSFSIPVQNSEIISFYKDWRNYEEQVDDVCLFGMKIN
jgi:serine phosphatase RsbU (regulator of sigma subunit)/tetratricopeptide (TPR) repeat protein|tara:strand:- start:26971 stop:29322 length:2352 start_codon:yes stop_codon:yes gene_type:complete